MRHVYRFLQLLAFLLWSPFRLVGWLGYLLHRGAAGAGNLLVRPLYWDVVQAKRRVSGQPLWQQRDMLIGIWPPCHNCGRNVPPDSHKKDCPFLKPHDLPNSLPSNLQAADGADLRHAALSMYVRAMAHDGVAVGEGDEILLGNILSALVADVKHAVERMEKVRGPGRGVPWSETAKTLRDLADAMDKL